ncbi:hypothetical protein JMJ35_000318 [Cladonia borealis]|uniref:Uncharacterized protein n=1 Tax=Cladonia borealis TaxID=184061 RepID=A0AA39RBE4_9LECA|nr:hypothetical protein JMJ35_000318 [Cladonia borealis]
MSIAFARLLDPAYKGDPTHRPYAGPAFLNSPPPSALPWPKFFKPSTLNPKSEVTSSPDTTPTSPPETGKQSTATSPPSTPEITTTEGETTKRNLSHAQTKDQLAAQPPQNPKPTNNVKGPTLRMDKYGRIQCVGKPLDVWERRAAQKATSDQRGHSYSTGELPPKHTRQTQQRRRR